MPWTCSRLDAAFPTPTAHPSRCRYLAALVLSYLQVALDDAETQPNMGSQEELLLPAWTLPVRHLDRKQNSAHQLLQCHTTFEALSSPGEWIAGSLPDAATPGTFGSGSVQVQLDVEHAVLIGVAAWCPVHGNLRVQCVQGVQQQLLLSASSHLSFYLEGQPAQMTLHLQGADVMVPSSIKVKGSYNHLTYRLRSSQASALYASRQTASLLWLLCML
jgi:hypothetical protein